MQLIHIDWFIEQTGRQICRFQKIVWEIISQLINIINQLEIFQLRNLAHILNMLKRRFTKISDKWIIDSEEKSPTENECYLFDYVNSFS